MDKAAFDDYIENRYKKQMEYYLNRSKLFFMNQFLIYSGIAFVIIILLVFIKPTKKTVQGNLIFDKYSQYGFLQLQGL